MHNENKLDKLFQKLVDNTISEMELDCLMELINSSDPDDVKNNILAKHWENVKTGNLPIKQRIKGDSEVLLQKILFKIEDIEKKKKLELFYRTLILDSGPELLLPFYCWRAFTFTTKIQ